MAEEFGEKTEAATPRRRQEAREEGRVARSADLTAASLLIGSMLLLKWFGPGIVGALRAILAHMLSGPSLSDLSAASAARALLWAIALAARAVAPLIIGLIVIAFTVNVLQVGFVLNPERLLPRLSAINPISNLGRIFKGPGLIKSLFSLFKLLLVGAVAYSAIHQRLGEIILVQRLTQMQIYDLGATVVFSIAMRIGVLLLVMALLDYGYQRFQHERNLRMSKQELREEMRRMEGDPKIKQRRRQIAVQLATKKLKKEVPTADVVVTNPTEYAVALKYDADTMRAPRVIAKGQDLMAKRIREIALEAGVPILERKPLARALFRLVKVGQDIPEQFYAALAEILAYVYQLTRKNTTTHS